MVKHDQIHKMLPAYALGCLDEEEAALVSEHLATCEKCNEQLMGYHRTVDALAFGSPGLGPPDSLKNKLMQRIQSTAEIEPVFQPVSKRLKWKFPLQSFSPAWALASLVIIVSLSVINFLQWHNTQTLQDEVAPDLLVLKMKGTYRAPKGDGTFVISQDRKKGVLVASDLPIPAESKQYQLWMKKDGQQVSGGVFSVTPTGYAIVEIESSESLSNFKSFEITLEPAGGSPTQTGHLYMISNP